MKMVRGNSRLLAAAALCAAVLAVVFLFSREPDELVIDHDSPGPLETLTIDRTSGKDKEQLRPIIRQLLDPATPRRMRIDLAINCELDFNAPEFVALLAEVSTPAESNVDPGWHSQYFHEICNLLQDEADVCTRFARVLSGVAIDERRPQVERDYAIQHLRRVWHQAGKDEDLRQAILLRFKSLVDGSPEVAGAAILSLHFLGSDPVKPWNASAVAISNAEIEPLVTGILLCAPDEIDPGTFMAALRVSGDRMLAGPSKRIEEIAGDTTAAAVVRMAAISIIAKSHDGPRAFLESIDRTNPQVDQAVRLALNESR